MSLKVGATDASSKVRVDIMFWVFREVAQGIWRDGEEKRRMWLK